MHIGAEAPADKVQPGQIRGHFEVHTFHILDDSTNSNTRGLSTRPGILLRSII